ncbi:hypothetical protein BCY91_02465 [Pelobium manganitolerans]|uniref:Aerotolerance regulator N-terminal domain-containing protein n=1 Tax=Pelobium manganitolerans TaxID=1842495 RepID=A0A419S7I4_9SPHI|nr:BatA domain-containing protein [Pelobium manganitolerans]RKD17294.1 hypothetical protein BCY91_02465 [Pelobium manganitolerans]
MGFLFPNFLYGLFFIAVPIAVHLFNFRRFKKVYFTNVAFLQSVEAKSAAARQLKERLLLLARILAIIFLVLAFAQPYLKTEQAPPQSQNNVVSVYVDNSYSMEAVNAQGRLLDEAKRSATDLTEAFDLNTRYQLLTSNLESNNTRLLSKDEFLEALEQTKITAFSPSYQQVVARQSVFLQNQHQGNRYAFLISDFQKESNSKPIKTDSSIRLNLVPLKANPLPNISVDSVYFISPFHREGQSESLVYRLKNHSDKKVENLSVSLGINGSQQALGTTNINANATVLDTLKFSGLRGQWQQAELKIKDYPITFDDQLLFAFSLQKQANITALYHQKPVKAIGAAYGTDDFFKLTQIDQSQLNYSKLASQQLVILENLTEVAPGLAQQLRQYVSNGGSLAVFIPLSADLLSYQRFLQSLETDFPQSLDKQENRATNINLQHPVFNDVFEQLPQQLDLPQANMFFQSSSLTRSTRQVLLRGTVSDNLLSAYSLGKGKIYLSFLPLEAEASNFTQHALFLPFLFKAALLSFNPQKMYYTLGADENIRLNSIPLGDKQVMKIYGEGTEIIPNYQNSQAGANVYFADQLTRSGFYQLKLADSLLQVFALNQNAKESAMAFYSDTELAQKFGVSGASIIKAKEKITAAQIKQLATGASFWKLCIILALVCLAAEIFIVRYKS